MIMDDQILDALCSNFDQAVTLSPLDTVDSDQIIETEKQDAEMQSAEEEKVDSDETIGIEKQDAGVQGAGQSEGHRELVDLDGTSNSAKVMLPDQGQNLPFVQKIEDLRTKVQIIKKEHALLCTEVKAFTADSLLTSETFTAIQNLNTENERLKKKCLEECTERKKLYNEVIELKGNIRVFCRVRPLKQDEIVTGSTSVVDFDSSQDNELHIISSDFSRKQFKFDYVFRPEDDQDAVFIQTVPIVTSVLDGYNVCIFAYGQTGTGKTYTMEGTPENRGVNYRTLEELFRLSDERSSIMRYKVFVSMLEVYNEKIRDLLVQNSNQPAKKLEIKQSAEGTQEVPGLVETRVYGTGEVWDLLNLGSKARSVGSTNANELSSRSHCLLRVTVMSENLLNGNRTNSHLWLVDLAGSERVGKVEVEGERLKESQFINKSLSALGDVISALGSKTSHVPYRNSKLTHMLQSSLGGDCKTLMFVQISPNVADLGETLCSLNFASRVRGVEHGPARKQTDHSELFKYKQLAEKAKHDEKEAKKLQDSLQSLQLKFSAREHICKNLQEKVRDLENKLAEERKIRLKQENRALATVSAQTSNNSNKPPLAPSTNLRLPLRRITNSVPTPMNNPTSSLSNRSRMSFLPVVEEDKENISSRMFQSKPIMKPRRGSIVVKPPVRSTNQALQPRRRASVATYQPETSFNMMTPLQKSSKAVRATNQILQLRRRVSVATFQPENTRTTLENSSKGGLRRSDRLMGRTSNLWDRQRVLRSLSIASPLKNGTIEATPMGPSKFKGSPPSQASGSWRSKHPTVVALQKKHLIWSPLKMRSMKNNRKSIV